MATISNKTVARIAAVQALYQFEMNNGLDTLPRLIDSIMLSYASKDFNEEFDIPKGVSVKLHRTHCKELITETINHLDTIDAAIKKYLSDGWSYSNLHISLASLLRVGIAELIYFPDVPYKVVINEFTNIGSSLVKQSEIPFINSLLDKVRLEYRAPNEQ